jgi:FkbM family methyltransferase
MLLASKAACPVSDADDPPAVANEVPMFSALRDRIRTANRHRIARRRLAAAPQQTPMGFKFSGMKQMMGLDWEQEEREMIENLLPRFDLFVNVGAHYGFYACIAQKLGIQTLALEPIPANCAMIAKHMQANGWGSKFTLLPVAAGGTSGFIEIQGGGSGGTVVKGFSMAPASQIQTVPVVRLDDVVALRSRRTLVLMDVEGFELSALQGAVGLLSASPKPVWIIEVLAHFGTDDALRPNPNYAETFRFMEQSGYRAWRIDATLTPYSVADATAALGQASGIVVSNFLFLDAASDLNALGLTEG